MPFTMIGKAKTSILLVGLLVSFFAAPYARSQERKKIHPEAVKIVMAQKAKQVARGGIVRARLDEKIILYAVVRAKLGDHKIIVTDAPSVMQGGKLVDSTEVVRPESIKGIQLKWFKVQPTGESYNNTAGGFHWDKIEYEEFPMGVWGNDWSIEADAHPCPPYEDTNNGAGTMAFMVRIRMNNRILSSPGKQSIFRGGLSDDVPRVAFRADDTYIGRLTELFNTPYIWGSSGTSATDHQAERLIGSDCADFIVYGARRLGKNIPYRATWHLPLVTKTIVRGQSVNDKGIFLDKAGHPLKINKKGIHIGDLLLFSGHVAALVKDETPLGILDDNDIIIHTYWAPPKKQHIRDSAYSRSKVRILRWK